MLQTRSLQSIESIRAVEVCLLGISLPRKRGGGSGVALLLKTGTLVEGDEPGWPENLRSD